MFLEFAQIFLGGQTTGENQIVIEIGGFLTLNQLSVVEVHSSHCFEHLGYQTELPTAIREVHCVLRVGGMFDCS